MNSCTLGVGFENINAVGDVSVRLSFVGYMVAIGSDRTHHFEQRCTPTMLQFCHLHCLYIAKFWPLRPEELQRIEVKPEETTARPNIISNDKIAVIQSCIV